MVRNGIDQRLPATKALLQMTALRLVASWMNAAVKATAMSATARICHSFGNLEVSPSVSGIANDLSQPAGRSADTSIPYLVADSS